jgi:hypothetical protein
MVVQIVSHYRIVEKLRRAIPNSLACRSHGRVESFCVLRSFLIVGAGYILSLWR